MKKVRTQSFKESIRKTFMIYALIPLVVVTVVVFLAVVFIFQGSAQSRTCTVVDQTTQGLEEVLSGYMAELEVCREDPSLLSAVKRGTMDPQQYARLYSYINAQQLRCNFFLTDRVNRIVASSSNKVPIYLDKAPIFNVGIVRKLGDAPEKICLSVEDNTDRSGKVLTLGAALQEHGRTVGMLIFEFEEQTFSEQFFDVFTTNIVLADRQDYVCWSTDDAFTNSYGKLSGAFQQQNGDVPFMEAVFYTQYRSLLAGELHLYAMSEIGAYQEIFSTVGMALIAILIVLLLSITLASREVADQKTEVIDHMVDTMQYARGGDFSHPLVVNTGDEFELMAETYNKMLGDIQQLIYDKEEIARQNVISEIKQLESQFDPHFLFNTLELIKYMAKIAPDDAGKVIVGFSALLRESINNTVSEVTLQQDWEYTQNYLMIQKYRFGDKLHYETELDPRAMCCVVPKRILQPIVENAMNYGRGSDGCCRLHIKTERKAGNLVISISDEGVGIEPQRLREIRQLLRQTKNTSVHNGLYNVHRRIDLIYGLPYGLSIKSRKGEGTRITMKLPAKTEETSHDESAGC